MWILILVITLVLTGAWIAFPFFMKKESWSIQQQLAAIDQNMQSREHLLRLLKDLEVEFETGGIDQAEYEKIQTGYLNEAALVTRRLKALQGDED